MSVDCSHLADIATIGNFADLKNEKNETLDTIWLNEDFIAPFNIRYWSTNEFLAVFLIYIILFIFMPIIFYFYVYPKYDNHKRLTYYLKTQKRHSPALRVDIKKLFQIYTKQSDNIIDIILDFADFQLQHKNIQEYINSKIKSTFNKKKVAGFSLCLWLMITICYFTIFHITVHWVDSYRSYVDIPCTIANIDQPLYINGNCEEDDGEWPSDNRYLEKLGKQCLSEFNFEKICNPNSINLSNYIVYSDRGIIEDSPSKVDTIAINCKINTKHFEYRQPTETCCGCCSECGRCNDCCNFSNQCWCGGACDTNACVYCTCIIFVLLPMLFGMFLMISGRYCFEHEFGYKIISARVY